MKNFIRAFLISISISLCLIAQLQFAIAQTASILPQAETQFLNNNGDPVTSGTVDFYIPNSSTRKSTWQDAGMTITNTNPVKLDGSGRALIYGYGGYRQVLKDRNGNLIWDRVTNSYAIPNGQVTSGDGNNVGTILQWSALTTPNQYVFAYGQELARVTYPELFAAITLNQSVNCTSGSNSLSGVADTSQIPIGASIEASCFANPVTVSAKTSTTYTVSANATVTTTVQATTFPFGNGNGTSTFNVPDLRGRVLAGRDNMGGIAASRLTTTYFANASAIGAIGGTQTISLSTVNLPAYTPTGNIASSLTSTIFGGTSGSTYGNGATTGPTGTTQINSTNTPINSVFTGIAQGGTSTPFSIVQPTVTINYIIKVTPDATGLVAAGVQNIQGMAGTITCNSSLTCASQTLGVNPIGLSAVLDSAFSSAQGSILYRGASAWLALPPGNSGYLFTTQGAGQNPVWGAPIAPPVTNQAANTLYAGPTTGSPATPAFRALVTADMPAGTGTGLVVKQTSAALLGVPTTTGALINTSTTQIANQFYADRAASLKMIDNGSASFILNLKPADGVTVISEPYVEGQIVEFTAPICANALIIPPSGNTYLIRDPAGANLLQCSAVTSGNVSDLKPNSHYRLSWHIASPSYWQLITPPQAESYNTPIVSQRYLQGNNDDYTLITSFKPRIFDTHLNQWKFTQFGNTTADIRNTYLYGVPGQALTVNHLYYVYEFTPASAPLGPGGVTDTSGVVLDFDDHYWNGAIDTATNFNADISGGTMTVLDTEFTNGITAIGNPTLHFASTPAWMKCVIPSDVGCGKTLSNLHSGHEASIPAGTTIIGSDATTVTMSKNVVSIDVSSGDKIMAINGKLEVGQPVVGGTVTPGSCITSGAGDSWTVTLTVGPTGPMVLTANNAHYYPGQDGIMQFINCAGNLETFVGMAFIQQRLAPATTNGGTIATANALHFAANTIPTSIVGLTVTDVTHPTAITAGTTVQSVTSTTVVISPAVSGPGVSSSDVIHFTAPSVNTIWNRKDAQDWGILPGNNTSSSPFSMMPQQPIVMFTPPQTPQTGSLSNGTLTPGTILADSFELGGSNTESTFISYDWAALNDFNPRTVVSCGAGSSGATVVMQVTQTPRAPLFGGLGETVVFEQSQICATASATVVFDSAIGVDWGDGSFLNKVKAAVSAGTATFSATPMQRALY